jgi:hypothetical protein
MDFQMTNDEKKKVIEDVKASVLRDIYVMLVKTGNDPDDFDVDTWVQPEIVTSGDEDNLIKLVKSLKNMNAKLEVLG